ncbi:MAG: type II toxin-antitoxin system prevent-host-death family antitoxin [Devosia sp.]|nr:type II toxin-antitoxin system prevent-host-death family antitoxin [Devosia sp.]
MTTSSRSPRITTMSAREFNQHTSRAKRAAEGGPVFITDRGKPAYVLLTDEEYRRLNRKPMSVAEALADPNYKQGDLDITDFIPEREIEPMRFHFDEFDDQG